MAGLRGKRQRRELAKALVGSAARDCRSERRAARATGSRPKHNRSAPRPRLPLLPFGRLLRVGGPGKRRGFDDWLVADRGRERGRRPRLQGDALRANGGRRAQCCFAYESGRHGRRELVTAGRRPGRKPATVSSAAPLFDLIAEAPVLSACDRPGSEASEHVHARADRSDTPHDQRRSKRRY